MHATSRHSKRVCICMSRYMTAMATRFFPRMALAAIGPGPGWRRPPKTRSEKLGTFRSYLTLLHFSVALDRENHDVCTRERRRRAFIHRPSCLLRSIPIRAHRKTLISALTRKGGSRLREVGCERGDAFVRHSRLSQNSILSRVKTPLFSGATREKTQRLGAVGALHWIDR